MNTAQKRLVLVRRQWQEVEELVVNEIPYPPLIDLVTSLGLQMKVAAELAGVLEDGDELEAVCV